MNKVMHVAGILIFSASTSIYAAETRPQISAIQMMQQDVRTRFEREMSGANSRANSRSNSGHVKNLDAEAECQKHEDNANAGDIAECENAIRIDTYDAPEGKDIVITFLNNERLQLIARKASRHFAGGIPLTRFNPERPADRLVLGGVYLRGGSSDFQNPGLPVDGEFGAGISYRFVFGQQRQN